MVDYVVMIAYLVITVFFGLWFSRKKEEKGTEDYLLGGRKMPWWAIGISLYVSLFSTISLVAAPGEAFNHGLTMVLFSFWVYIFGIPAFHMFTRFYFRVKTFTPFEYLEHRFDHRVRLVGSLSFWMIRFMYLGIVLFASAKVFEGASNWPGWFTIIIVGLVGTVYTALGGMKAVVWTDVLQFVVLVIGITWIVVECAVNVPGGIGGIISYAFDNGRGFQGLDEPEFFSLSPYVRLSFWGMLFFHFYDQIFQKSGDQISIQRLLSTSSYKEATKSFYIFILISIPFGPILYFLGLSMFAFYGHHNPGEELTGDTVLFRFIATELPIGIAGMVLSAMLAAVMSTLDSGMNSLAAVATKDIYLRYLRPKATDLQQLWFSRIVTIGVGIMATAIGLMIALVSEKLGDTFIEVGAIWMAFSCVVPPIYLVGVTTTRVNSTHILWGVLLGWITTVIMIVWYLLTRTTDRSVSFLWVDGLGCIVMAVFCYLPVLFRFKKVDAIKTNGLTLWTLKSK
jgi:SSS family transporter